MADIYTKRGGSIRDGMGVDAHAYDTVRIPRADMSKNRHLVSTKAGKEVEIRIRRGRPLEDGDILLQARGSGDPIAVKQAPERVAVVRFSERHNDGYDYYDSDFYDVPLMVGHMVGSMRRPLSFFDDILEGYGMTGVSFPIRGDAELQTFERILKPVLKHIRMDIQERVFVPHVDADMQGIVDP